MNEADLSSTMVINGVEIQWNMHTGRCRFRGEAVAMMWIETTLARLMSGFAVMVGTERFVLALQEEGRKSVEVDWALLSGEVDFPSAFNALNTTLGVAGWGHWQLIKYAPDKPECIFRAYHHWEGLYQRTLGVCWGSAFLAGKLSGICSKLFKTPCWATQTHFIAQGADFDEFIVTPSLQTVEDEVKKLLLTDQATRAEMAVALKRLKEREQQLHAANIELKKLTHIAAHHLQEPARRIVSFVQHLKRQIDVASLNEEARQSLEFISQSAFQQRALVQDIERYLVAVEPRDKVQQQDTNSLLKKLHKQFLPKLNAAKIELIINSLPPAFLDRPRLIELFTLLLENALHHAKPMVSEETVNIIITGERENNLSRYFIHDEGVGIPVEYHERLFEISERLGRNEATELGIELAIAKRIVESRQGKIWIETSACRGTTVIFELPDGEVQGQNE